MPIDYVEEWRRIVVSRRAQHDAVARDRAPVDDYWARRAAGYHKFVHEGAAEGDPFVSLLRRHLRPDDVLLDVGAGTGRHAVPLARHVQRVVAVDPSPAMLAFLREDATAQGQDNIDVIEGTWPDIEAQAPVADVAYSAHVLYPIEDVVPFLRALDAHAERLCFLHLMARQPWFDQLGLWDALYGQPRLPQPTYLDAVNLLHQLGCYSNVEIAWTETGRTFDSLDEAAERMTESLAIGGDAARTEQLKAVLEQRLEPAEGGRFKLPAERYPLATVWWEAGALQSG